MWCSICQSTFMKNFCIQCSMFLCEDCLETHSTDDHCASHETLEVEKDDHSVLKCEDHSAQYIKRFCSSCKTLVCQICLLSSHRGHATKTVTDMARDWDIELSVKIPPIRKLCKEKQEELGIVRDTIQSNRKVYKMIMRRVYQHSQDMKKKLQDQTKAVIEVLGDQFKIRDEKLTKLKDEYRNQIRSTEKICSQAENNHSTIDKIKSTQKGDNISGNIPEKENTPHSGCDVASGEWQPLFQKDDFSLGRLRLNKYDDNRSSVELASKEQADTENHVTLYVSKVSCEFHIENFMDLENDFYSPVFEVQDIPWCLKITKNSDYYGMYIKCLLDSRLRWSCDADFRITLEHPSDSTKNILIQSGPSRHIMSKETFTAADTEKGCDYFIKQHTKNSESRSGVKSTKRGMERYTSDGAIVIKVRLQADPPHGLRFLTSKDQGSDDEDQGSDDEEDQGSEDEDY